MTRRKSMVSVSVVSLCLLTTPSHAAFFFSNGDVTNSMATASQPSNGGNLEIEAADDFTTTKQTQITYASFTGLLTGTDLTVQDVVIEIYRVFPNDSTLPPSGNVPTRNNSPSDVAFDSRDSATNGLSFSTTIVSASFTALNSVLNGINAQPNQNTLGEGPVTGEEVTFNITFLTPFDLPPDHYFFVPQVELSDGQFYWLSSVRPIVSPGTPFLPDLQEWIRNENLAPDWLRVGTDIVGGTTPPTFNAAFTLTGTVPEPLTLSFFGAGLAGVVAMRRRKKTA